MTSSSGRGTIREIDDDHLCQECKTGDTGFSRTHTGFEMWTPLGLTGVAVKQKEDKQQQQQKGQQGGGDQSGGYNKKQPQGEAAEMIVSYMNGSAAHPIGMANDRRTRPYGLKQGEVGLYSADGSGQLVYHRTRGDQADGLYMLTCDDQQGESTLLSDEHKAKNGGQNQKRMVSIRHVVKPKQRRKKEKKQQASPQAADGGGQDTGRLPDDSKSDYKHEGKEINTEAQFTDQRINFNEGAGAVGYYDRKKDWLHHMPGDKKLSSRCDKDHTHIMSEKENCLWVSKKEKGVFASKPLIIKPDECDV